MADCKRCDRCGIYYEGSDVFKATITKIANEKIKGPAAVFSYALGGNTIAFNKIDLKSSCDSWIGPIDLCPECGKELYKWLTNVVNVEEENDGKSRTKKAEEKA